MVDTEKINLFGKLYNFKKIKFKNFSKIKKIKDFFTRVTFVWNNSFADNKFLIFFYIKFFKILF